MEQVANFADRSSIPGARRAPSDGRDGPVTAAGLSMGNSSTYGTPAAPISKAHSRIHRNGNDCLGPQPNPSLTLVIVCIPRPGRARSLKARSITLTCGSLRCTNILLGLAVDI